MKHAQGDATDNPAISACMRAGVQPGMRATRRSLHACRRFGVIRADVSGGVVDTDPNTVPGINVIPKSRWVDGVPPVMGAHLMDSGTVRANKLLLSVANFQTGSLDGTAVLKPCVCVLTACRRQCTPAGYGCADLYQLLRLIRLAADTSMPTQ
jgi:hypothetical protein